MKGEKHPSGVLYKFSHRVPENQLLKFVPVSSKLLFQPDFVEYRTIDDCANNVIKITGEKGLIIEGRIDPPLGNVKITLKFKDGSDNNNNNNNSDQHGGELLFLTKDDGKYKFGPLKSALNFE